MTDIFDSIVSNVTKNNRVLDCGCGDGTLLETLRKQKQVIGYGIDFDSENVMACIKKGVSVFQGDINDGLKEMPDQSFDVVILSHTLQQVRNPIEIIKEMCRVGKHAIVTFPNFAHWRCRWKLLRGYIPETKSLPYSWYNTPNIRVISSRSFKKVCLQENIIIKKQIAFNHHGQLRHGWGVNLLAEQLLFILSKS
jgi:methionine biosynthesis protein MetW